MVQIHFPRFHTPVPNHPLIGFGNMMGMGGKDLNAGGLGPLAVQKECQGLLLPSKEVQMKKTDRQGCRVGVRGVSNRCSEEGRGSLDPKKWQFFFGQFFLGIYVQTLY